VHYNLEDMLGIVALESVRNRCVVVGEDLGTVPETLRARLRETHIFSSRLVHFERNWETGAFLAPETYPRFAAASIGTHDLPTLAGWWLGDDIALRVRIGLYPDDEAVREAGEDRWAARFALIDALETAGTLDAAGAERLREDARRNGSREAVAELAVAVHGFLRKTPAALVVVAIEDLLGELDAVNVPGTVDEHPNWHRKRIQGLEALRIDETALEEIAR
jgi:4-alpha-glucanotransferase